MTNLSSGAHHKIYGVSSFHVSTADSRANTIRTSSEGGYTLVALLAMMTLMALIAVSAAPSLRQQALREREKEAIFRGEQVADAIRDFYIYRVGTSGGAGEQALPNSMDQLLEGIPIQGGSKKRQVLRASASRDPLSTTGEWRTVRPRAQELIEFQRLLVTYAGNILPAPTNGQIEQLQQFAVPQITSVLDTGSENSAPGGEDTSADSSGPFVGVTSRSRNNSVLYYYGIDRHDKWIFTPLFR